VTVLLLGANHDTATVAVRECLSIPPERIASALRFLSRSVGEVVLISTCNRTEFYVLNPPVAEPILRRFLHGHATLPDGELDRALYRLDGEEAVRHLTRVASGLDSMILGEPQILGQVREAWRVAKLAGSLGPVTDALFRTAINCGKAARARTGIARGGVSVSQSAVEFARERFGQLSGCTVLVLGAGDTGALVARNLQAHGAGSIIVANRTFERAAQLAQTLNARAVSFGQLQQALHEADIVIGCTGAPQPVLSRAMLAEALPGRESRPLVAIDIAVPRDIDPMAADLPGVSIFDLDDLHQRMAANRAAREAAASIVETTVERHVQEFQAWYAGHASGATIRAVRDKAERIRREQLQRALRRMPDLSPQDRQTVNILTEQLVNALLHDPLTKLRDPNHGETNAAYLASLFDVDIPSPPLPGVIDSDVETAA
jgi:glutamyl-tRNA reductase